VKFVVVDIAILIELDVENGFGSDGLDAFSSVKNQAVQVTEPSNLLMIH